MVIPANRPGSQCGRRSNTKTLHIIWQRRLARHGFIPAALLILSGALVASRTAEWAQEARVLEAALLFDLAVLLPALYFLCYRLRAKTPALRAVAIACGGVWLATYLVPSEHQTLLPAVAFLRYGAIAVLVYVELRVIAALYWSIIVGRVTAEDATAHLMSKAGVPKGIAIVMAKEAAFWRRVLARPISLIGKHLRRGDGDQGDMRH